MTTLLAEAMEDINIAFLQLEFAIKLLSFCELGNVDPIKFDTDHVIVLPEGNLNFPTGHFDDADRINRAASISVLLAFSASVLVLDQAFEIARMRPDPERNDDAGRLRTLIYMVRCAQAHGIAEPRWEVRGKFSRTLEIDSNGIDISLDLHKLHGQRFNVEQIGGYTGWYRIYNAAVRLLTQSSPVPTGSHK